jgi:hypothetical protein
VKVPDRCVDTRCYAPVSAVYLVRTGIEVRRVISACRAHEMVIDYMAARGCTIAVPPVARGRVGDCP